MCRYHAAASVHDDYLRIDYTDLPPTRSATTATSTSRAVFDVLTEMGLDTDLRILEQPGRCIRGDDAPLRIRERRAATDGSDHQWEHRVHQIMWHWEVFSCPELTPELWPRSRYIWSPVQCHTERLDQVMRWSGDERPSIPPGDPPVLDTVTPSDTDNRMPRLHLTHGGWYKTPLYTRHALKRDIKRCGKSDRRLLILLFALHWTASVFAHRETRTLRQRGSYRPWGSERNGPRPAQDNILVDGPCPVRIGPDRMPF
jgi:hypothetical protein